MASASATSRVDTPTPPPPGVWLNWPGRTISRLLPRLATLSPTSAVVPCPSVTMVMTAATPMVTPSTVSIDRSALRQMAPTASLIDSSSMRVTPG